MSDAKSKPMTLKGILALIGAGLVYLVSQVLGIDLTALGGKDGDAGSGAGSERPPITAPADPTPTKEVVKNEPEPSSGKTLDSKKPAAEAPGKRDDTALIKKLFQTKQSDTQVEAEGEIVFIFPEDMGERKHQRFLVELSNDITLKIAHNIDLAPEAPIRKGDTIRFYGEYEYNDKGGVVHWTHRTKGTNPHPHGWLLHKGKKYE
ncbi:MAG: DUF3465 domain-containing protein [Planctomycetota bacterium]